jgi:phosphopantothenoylcysteine synthetase/decarboxylase
VFSDLVPAATAALPGADLVVVVPATFNTITKLAHATSDTLALAVTNEALGGGVPVLLVPWCNPALRAHPAFPEAVRRLTGWGFTVLDAEQGSRLPWADVRSAIAGRLPG